LADISIRPAQESDLNASFVAVDKAGRVLGYQLLSTPDSWPGVDA
jgi:hypothetical protein